MCSIGNSSTMSLAGALPSSTLLGSTTPRTPVVAGVKRALGGTLLGGSPAAPSGPGAPSSGGGGSGGRGSIGGMQQY